MTLLQLCKISQSFVFWLVYPKGETKQNKVLYHFKWTNCLKMGRVSKTEAYNGRKHLCEPKP